MADIYLPNKTKDGTDYNIASGVDSLACDISLDCIRDGHVFYFYHKFENVANGTTAILTFNVCPPATNALLLENNFSSSAGLIEIDIKEDVTVTTAGTAITVFNRNRNSDNTTCITASYGDIITGGTIVSEYIAGSAGNPASRSGGSVSKQNPVVLKDNTVYSYEITNASGTTQDILCKIEIRNGEYTV